MAPTRSICGFAPNSQMSSPEVDVLQTHAVSTAYMTMDEAEDGEDLEDVMCDLGNRRVSSRRRNARCCRQNPEF